eukprot:TRINITY_DN458_c0_g1_i1.p1 TRINITY_DN458_c0_g1~~TRINITY_DN458_c0_g1_i1.p1  ORF type:complete len:673 (-),score=224.38 TRINITY_DN458_c0_g1_i1:70-2088(-)
MATTLGKWNLQTRLDENGQLVVSVVDMETGETEHKQFGGESKQAAATSAKSQASATSEEAKSAETPASGSEKKEEKKEEEKKEEKATSTTEVAAPTPESKPTDAKPTEESKDGKSEEKKEDGEPTYKSFEVRKKAVRHTFTNEIIDHVNVIEIKDQSCIPYLKSYIHSSGLYKTPPRFKAEELFQCREQLASYLSIPAITELLEYINSQYAAVTAKLDNMIKNDKVITYKALWFLFTKGKKIVGTTDDGNKLGAEINSANYVQGIFPTFDIQGSIIKANGKQFYTTTHRFRIVPFSNTKKLDELPVQLLDEKSEVYQKLLDRGRKFAKLGTGVHYKDYTGYIQQREGWFGYQLYKATGRVILDGVSFNRMNPNSRSGASGMFSMDRHNEQSNSFDSVVESKYFMTWPTILGFSFVAKKWGELAVSQLGEVVFDDQAYGRLVLPAEQKLLIKALVQNCDHTFNDIITGKGGGCIFLLHGHPGVGKTLTAESIAELLHRPLYSVSVGELGTDTVELEKRLREILEVSSSWNAVILLDEADIFLEKRSEDDITRNAMVGIFLRLLEYHQGVLFLTTNRVKCFDRAFHSRISVAIKYENLTVESRKAIWDNILGAAGVKGMNTDDLAKYDLNGRQIRTMTRLALSLAKAENVEVNKTHLERTIRVAEQFNIDVGGV